MLPTIRTSLSVPLFLPRLSVMGLARFLIVKLVCLKVYVVGMSHKTNGIHEDYTLINTQLSPDAAWPGKIVRACALRS